MSILSDFFGDSETAVEECSLCGCKDDLTVTVSDAYGPTHWICEGCKAEQNKEKTVATIDNSDEGNFATVTVTIVGEVNEMVYQAPVIDLEKEINARNADIKHEVTTIEELTEKLSNANPKHTGYIKQLKQRRLVLLKKKAAALVDAPSSEQYDFICTAPEGEWRELLEIVLPGAHPTVWERKRKAYVPNWQEKATKKAEKRRKNRKAYAKNGGSVYPSKKHNNNGTFNMLPIAQA